MGSTKTAFKKSILARVEEGLATLSFSKRGVGFTRELGGETSGYVGLPVSTHLPHNRIGIAPVVGIIHAPLESLVKKLSDSSPYLNGLTLASAVGYLTPLNKFLEWVFDPTLDPGSEVSKMIRAVKEYGLPFMQKHTGLNSIVAELEAKRFTFNQVRRYRLPVAYFLAGRREDARKFLERELKEFASRNDAAGSDFRHFAQAFMKLSG